MKKILITFLLILIIISIFFSFSYFFQKPLYFPKPTGKYNVGTKTLYLVDQNRIETLEKDPTHPLRELMIQIWYPAQGIIPNKPTTPYSEKSFSFIKNTFPNLSKLFFPKKIFSYAQFDQTILYDKYPIIIFSHGFAAADKNSNTAQCEELASHGYVVIGISHTYFSASTQFPDGREITINKLLNKLQNINLDKAIEKSNEFIEIWIADVKFVIDTIEKLTKDKNSFFYDKLDIKKIGIFGHSYGGATSIQSCSKDCRIKCAVDMDGSLFGEPIKEKINKPTLFILADESLKPFSVEQIRRLKNIPQILKGINKIINKTINEFIENNKETSKKIIIEDTKHMAFCDLALIKNSTIFGKIYSLFNSNGFGIGEIDGKKVTKIVNSNLVNFFDKYLKN